MNDRGDLSTEQPLAASANLDAMSVIDAVALMTEQSRVAVDAVATQQAAIAAAIDLIVVSQRTGGRLFYFGAGTSGRLGVLDASECPPTFRSDPQAVQGVIAGGERAMFQAQEGVEDDAADGAKQVDDRHIGVDDVVIGIAAGGTTPFVHGALHRARERGAKTVFISCVQAVPTETQVDVVIRPITGPEVLTGSTRLKAGTATKLVLNALTTLAMVQLGKTYGNAMVDLRATNAKLRDRATRLVMSLTNLDREASAALLDAAGGHVKTAVAMYSCSEDKDAATARLAAAGGSLRRAIGPE